MTYDDIRQAHQRAKLRWSSSRGYQYVPFWRTRVLEYVREHQPATTGELAALIGKPPKWLTPRLKALQAQGLIRIDNRKVYMGEQK